MDDEKDLLDLIEDIWWAMKFDAEERRREHAKTPKRERYYRAKFLNEELRRSDGEQPPPVRRSGHHLRSVR